jgi:hypothetical protein
MKIKTKRWHISKKIWQAGGKSLAAALSAGIRGQLRPLSDG